MEPHLLRCESSDVSIGNPVAYSRAPDGQGTDSLFPCLVGPLTEVRSLEGQRVMLPCEVAPPIPGDDIILVLFYRGALGTPIYR
ncbi:hypothetical protein E2C01_061648 [Portunus trituberculatus]|uniref:Uncharacterized protein n=1 Tax=Portunus trituberculatus TaxID=210409 RepID=A0A5B7H4F2_PORTR|nr:hypothetical protein [Portunus trituberculatus]